MRYLLIGCLFMSFLLTSCDDEDPASSSADPDPDPDPQELVEYFRANVDGELQSFPVVSFRQEVDIGDDYVLTGQEIFERAIIIHLNGNSAGTYELDPRVNRISAEYQHIPRGVVRRGLLGSVITLDDDAPDGYVKGTFYLRMTEDFEIKDGEFLAKIE